MQILMDALDRMDESDFEKLIERLPYIARDLEALRDDVRYCCADASSQVTELRDRMYSEMSNLSDKVEQCNR